MKRIFAVVFTFAVMTFCLGCASPKEDEIILKFAKAPIAEPREQAKLLNEDEIKTKCLEYYAKLGFGSNKAFNNAFNKLMQEKDYRNSYSPIDEIAVLSPKYDDYYDTIIYSVHDFITIEIDGKDGRLLFLCNHIAMDYFDEYEPIPFPAEPTKTKEEVIKAAERYRQAAMGDLPKGMTFGAPEATFTRYGDVLNGRGQWQVAWQRYVNGVKVWGGDIKIRMYEKLNLILIGFNAINLFDITPVTPKITKQQAERIAWKVINTKLTRYVGKVTSNTQTELLYNRPGFYFDQETDKKLIDRRREYLVYRVGFFLNSVDWNKVPPEMVAPLPVIEIDAETGEVLDADVPM